MARGAVAARSASREPRAWEAPAVGRPGPYPRRAAASAARPIPWRPLGAGPPPRPLPAPGAGDIPRGWAWGPPAGRVLVPRAQRWLLGRRAPLGRQKGHDLSDRASRLTRWRSL